MDGLVSKANDFFLFFVLEIAAAAAIPVGPADAVKIMRMLEITILYEYHVYLEK